MTTPNLMIVGMPRAGTTFMWENLRKHPDIFAPAMKATHYHLADRWPLNGPEREAFTEPMNAYLSGKKKRIWGGLMTSSEAYSDLYAPGENALWRLEATPNYFAEGKDIAARISEKLGPETRVIVMLRDPVERILSHFRMFRDLGWETESFEGAIASGPSRLEKGWAPTWDYLNYSRIEQPLAEWREIFGNRLKVILHTDLALHPHETLAATFRWLNLPPQNISLGEKLNANDPTANPVISFAGAELAVRATGRIDVDSERDTLAKLVDTGLTPPLVSIGMPVRSGAKSIIGALESLTSQSYKNIEIVVCDNASDDNTREVVEEFAKGHDNIKLLAFDTGVDIQQSYRRALESRRGEYFLFAPADDSWDPRFIERAVQYMQRNPNASVCCGEIELVSGDGKEYRTKGTIPISGSARNRWTKALFQSPDAIRIYGLLRSNKLANIIPNENPEGWDHYTAAKLAANGDIGKISAPAMLRERTPTTYYRDLIEEQESTTFGRIFFMRHVTRIFRADPEIKTTGLKENMALWYLVLSHARTKEHFGYRLLCSILRRCAGALRLLNKIVP